MDRPGETWIDISLVDDLYSISNRGRIKRKRRHLIDSIGRPRTVAEKIIISSLNKDVNLLEKEWTYRLQVVLQVDNQKYSFQIPGWYTTSSWRHSI